MLERNTFLGGYLVGIGKIRTNGEVEYQELEKPIHNKIVSVGLDHLFQWGGSTNPDITSNNVFNFSTPLLVGTSSENGNRAGALHYVSLGSGASATSFTDTSLESPVWSNASSKYTISGSSQALNGTKINSFGNYSFRVSHKAGAVSSTLNINEIGWFGAYGTNYSTKVMFARVVLPSTITLNAGEYLITTYQLDLTCANSTPSTISDFFGLKDSNGNTLQAEQKLYMYQTYRTNDYTWSKATMYDYITSSAETLSETTYSRGGFVSPYYFSNHSGYYNKKAPFFYSTNSSTTFPTDGSYSSLTSLRTDANFSVTSVPYTGAGSTNKYRDRIVTFGSLCPGMSDPSSYQDIYFLRFLNKDYRFGYYDNGVWVPQAWRKYANQSVDFTLRTRYSTEDTTLS